MFAYNAKNFTITIIIFSFFFSTAFLADWQKLFFSFSWSRCVQPTLELFLTKKKKQLEGIFFCILLFEVCMASACDQHMWPWPSTCDQYIFDIAVESELVLVIVQWALLKKETVVLLTPQFIVWIPNCCQKWFITITIIRIT